MKKLIQRQRAEKYLTNGWCVTFIAHFEQAEPVEITKENIDKYIECCGDWYAQIPLKIGDILYYPGDLHKIIKIGKRKIKMKNTRGEKERALISDILIDKHIETKVKIPQHIRFQ